MERVENILWYDEVISEGGGSVIDVGKYVAKKLKLKHVAIPTTAGTGSEMTKYCVLMIKGKKTTLVDEKFVPTSYILDPTKLRTLSKEQIISSGLDALCQGYESLWSKNATEESKKYSEMAVYLIEKNIKKIPNDHTMMDMLIGANMSGRAINITKTNICHAISYPLTELYDIPHGLACYISLRYFAKKVGLEPIEVEIPHYEIDINKIVDIVIKSDKLKDYPLIITKDDIFSCLNEAVNPRASDVFKVAQEI